MFDVSPEKSNEDNKEPKSSVLTKGIINVSKS